MQAHRVRPIPRPSPTRRESQAPKVLLYPEKTTLPLSIPLQHEMGHTGVLPARKCLRIKHAGLCQRFLETELEGLDGVSRTIGHRGLAQGVVGAET